MGGANNICSDKTGTLTKNEMTWTNIWAGESFAIKNAGGEDSVNMGEFVQNDFTKMLIEQAISVNTTGTHIQANATEKAMLRLMHKCGVKYEELRKQYVPSGSNVNDMIQFGFNSTRKRMSTVAFLSDIDKTEHGYPKRLHTKGASEIILETCSHYLDQ